MGAGYVLGSRNAPHVAVRRHRGWEGHWTVSGRSAGQSCGRVHPHLFWSVPSRPVTLTHPPTRPPGHMFPARNVPIPLPVATRASSRVGLSRSRHGEGYGWSLPTRVRRDEKGAGGVRWIWNGLMHPARIVPAAFLVAVVVGTMLLSLPFATPGPSVRRADRGVHGRLGGLRHRADHGRHRDLLVAVRAGRDHGLIQVGGFGIMTLATLLACWSAANWGSVVAGRPGRDPHPQHRRRPARRPPGRDHRAGLRGRHRGRPHRPVLGRLRRLLGQALGTGCSTRSRRSTTPGSPSTATT